MRASARNTVIGAAPAASEFTVSRARISMGTLVAIEATVPLTSHAEASRTASTETSVATVAAALKSAFAAIVAVEQRLHPLTPGSDLQRISSAPVGTPVRVDVGTWQLLQLAARLYTLTGGAFDPCLPSRPGRLSDVELSVQPERTSDMKLSTLLVTCHARVALDFGGFAKGFAVDCAIDALVAGGCSAGLVNAGGDLRCFGPRPDPIFLRQPDGRLTPFNLVDAALAVSDAESTRRPPEHQGYYVRGGAGNLVRRYAAVVAERAVVADALAKCLLLCSPPVADRALREFSAINIQQG